MQRSNNPTAPVMKALPSLLLMTVLVSGCSILRPHPDTSATAPAATNGPAQTAVQKTPDKADADARFSAALDLMKQKQNPQAEQALSDLAKDFPQYSGPLTDLGILYGRSNRQQQALDAFSHAVAANPQNAVAYNWLGILYRESGDYPRAEQAYRKALEINADSADAHLNLGILYDSYLNRPADALAQYKEYQRLGGMDDLRVAVWMAEIEKAQPASSTLGAAPQPAAPAVTTPPPKKQP